ncbi:MAG: hypothetical protein R3Y24_16135 [Eubacteriales bacterium]
MEQLLDKIGLYDILVLLFTGLFMYIYTIFVVQQLGLDYVGDIISSWGSDPVVLVVASYFIGMVFQEITSVIQQKFTNKNDRLLTQAWEKLEEKEGIENYFASNLPKIYAEQSIRRTYNYCRMKVLLNKKNNIIERQQTTSAMGRSLSLFFAIYAVILFLLLLQSFNIKTIIFLILSISMCIVFYVRHVRYFVLRYTYIFKIFYYHIVQ